MTDYEVIITFLIFKESFKKRFIKVVIKDFSEGVSVKIWGGQMVEEDVEEDV